MRRIINNIFKTMLAASLLTACSDLELDESVYHTKTWQFSDFNQVKSVMTNVYGYLEDGFSPIGTAMRDCASDDAVCALAIDPVMTFYDGSWSELNLIDDKWNHYYAGIRAANYLIENCPDDFPQAQYKEDYKYNLTQLKNFKLEARALRAYFHFELLKRYNNIVIADKTYTEKEVALLDTMSYQEAAEWIVNELELCYSEKNSLPDNYESGNQAHFTELGRVAKGFAIAAKTRVQLYAASPLNNLDNDKSKWLEAAKSAKEFLDWNPDRQYTLNPFNFNNEKSSDLIFGIRLAANSNFEAYNFPVGYDGGSSGTCPTQNLVEAFDLLDGTEFDWDLHKDKKPEERDPRFAKTILSNGDWFKGRNVESFYRGQDGLPRDNASPTSYYLKKFIQASTSFEAGNLKYYQHVYPIFRFPEIYLNYAEALFEYNENPDEKGIIDGVTFTMTPVEAVNRVRQISGMPPLESGMSAEDFRRRLRKERRVELAFEDHRFWDVRRWKIGEETEDIWGLEIKAQEGVVTSVDKKVVAQRKWEDKYYFYPIPLTERHKNNNLVQNTGW